MESAAGRAELPVRVSEHVAQGSLFVPFNQPGLRANGLLGGSFSIAATISAATGSESDREPVASEAPVEGAA